MNMKLTNNVSAAFLENRNVTSQKEDGLHIYTHTHKLV